MQQIEFSGHQHSGATATLMKTTMTPCVGFLCTAGLDALRVRRVSGDCRARDGVCDHGNSGASIKALIQWGFEPVITFFSLSERWCHDQLNYLKPSSLLRCLRKLILTEHRAWDVRRLSDGRCGRRRWQSESELRQVFHYNHVLRLHGAKCLLIT